MSAAASTGRAAGKSRPARPAPIHRAICAESAAVKARGRPWSRTECPALASLLDAAIFEARARRRLRGRIVFDFQGKQYAARFTNFDRVIVEDAKTGEWLASSGFFAL